MAYCFLAASDPTWFEQARNILGYAKDKARLKVDEARGQDFIRRVVEALQADPNMSEDYKSGMGQALLAGDYPEEAAIPFYCAVAGFKARVSTEHDLESSWVVGSVGEVGVELFNSFHPAHWSLRNWYPSICQRSYELPLWQCCLCNAVYSQDGGGEDGPLLCVCGAMNYRVE